MVHLIMSKKVKSDGVCLTSAEHPIARKFSLLERIKLFFGIGFKEESIETFDVESLLPSELSRMTETERFACDLCQSFDMKLTIHDYGMLIIKLGMFKRGKEDVLNNNTQSS